MFCLSLDKLFVKRKWNTPGPKQILFYNKPPLDLYSWGPHLKIKSLSRHHYSCDADIWKSFRSYPFSKSSCRVTSGSLFSRVDVISRTARDLRHGTQHPQVIRIAIKIAKDTTKDIITCLQGPKNSQEPILTRVINTRVALHFIRKGPQPLQCPGNLTIRCRVIWDEAATHTYVL